MASLKCKLVVLCLLLPILGCGSNPGKYDDPTEVSGTIQTTPANKLANINVTLQPLDSGHMTNLQIDNGKVTGKAIPGKYAYYLSAGKDGSKSLKGLPEKWLSGDMARVVEVVPGKPITLVLEQ